MNQKENERIILGIDPGTNILGYGLIIARGKKLHLIELDVIHLSKLKGHALKLQSIFSKVLEIIDKHKPD